MALFQAMRGAVRMQPLKRFAPSSQITCRSFAKMSFAKTHEWVNLESDGTGFLGISHFAANALGEVVYCDLPSEGATFSAKETICTLESVKAVGEVYAPGDIEVLEVNEKLAEEPALVNSSPEADGWLLKVKVTGDLSSLMDRDAYDKHAATSE
uniref:Glycine cleavage system H protein n=1 Tax=Karlodinium veneficum TaxID=407301 RepID=F2WQ78_KARVE|nr:mitochondrial glycine cleavage system H-like protein 1 [Karlodinium veneficum]